MNIITNTKTKEITPTEYFDYLKEKKQRITDKDLIKLYENCLELLNKYIITGQTKGMKKLIFHLENIERERAIVKLGINNFIYRDDLEEYIDNIAKNTVKVIELENYEREIPDEVLETIITTKDIFDQFYIVFTDYTGKVERQIQKERRDKDPILFGTFQSKKDNTIIDRFYFLADWEDEKCDLTFDKMLNEFNNKTNKKMNRAISTPKDIKELKDQLYSIDEIDNKFIIDTKKQKQHKTLFKNIKTFFKRNR